MVGCLLCDSCPSQRVLWDKYYADTHAVLFVVDSADPARFKDALAELGLNF